MIGRFLFMSAAAGSLAGLCVGAVAATKNVDIVVTHNPSSLITTYTVQETSGNNQPAGMVYIAGQSFRRGDLPPGTYPVFRDAHTHVPLVQQLDEIATRRENGDDGSIRHLVFSVQLPTIPANGTYQMEIVKQTGTYTAAAKQTLAKLAAAHDLKLHLTDVRNQDGSVRGSGSLTFDINAAAANTGRDAPRSCAAGPVRDCWIVVGPPIDDATHRPDPLLYVTCYLDLTTSSSDQALLGPVRHVCRVDNSWMNVAAGSTGNPGNLGPAGYANDPQAISYRPQLLDGNSNLMDWSWYDASVNSSSNPIVTGGDNQTQCTLRDLKSNGVLNIPTSTATNPWYYGMAVSYSNSGTPPAGMTNGSIYFVYPIGAAYSSLAARTFYYNLVDLSFVPSTCSTNYVMPSSQGSGTQNFSFRVWHTHWMSWYTVDGTGLENWTNGTSRTTSPWLPRFTAAEQLYWKETGTIPPLVISTTPSDPTPSATNMHIYGPMGHNNVIGGAGVGGRPDLGLVNEYTSQAWLCGTNPSLCSAGLTAAQYWQRPRVFALTGASYPWATLLNEATGRIPVLNNGPPTSNHAGGGRSYPALGAPFGPSGLSLCGAGAPGCFYGVAHPLENVPSSIGWSFYRYGPYGTSSYSYGEDHEPSFYNLIYQVFGSRHYLDAIYMHANRANYTWKSGPGESASDNIVSGVHYYGTFYCIQNCERRDAFWSYREKMLCAAFGSDSNPERSYCNDMLVENYWYDAAREALVDGASTNYRGSLFPPASGIGWVPQFIDAYGLQTSYQSYAMLRDPLSVFWMPKWMRTYIARCSDPPGSLSSYYCGNNPYEPGFHDSAGANSFPNTVAADTYNVTDDADYGVGIYYFRFTNGSGTISWNDFHWPNTANGDQVKFDGCTALACTGTLPPDELNTATWYTVTNVSGAPNYTLQLICPLGTPVSASCPTPGSPYVQFTTGGQPYTGLPGAKVRPIYNPSAGWDIAGGAEPTYLISILYGLHDLGFSQINAAITTMTNRGLYLPAGNQTWQSWDPNVAVP